MILKTSEDHLKEILRTLETYRHLRKILENS